MTATKQDMRARNPKPSGDDSMIRLDVDEYTVELIGGTIYARGKGRGWKYLPDEYSNNLILSLMTRIIELQRIIASNRGDGMQLDEWAIAEQRAGEMLADDGRGQWTN